MSPNSTNVSAVLSPYQVRYTLSPFKWPLQISYFINHITGVYNISRLYNYKIAGMPLARWSFVAPSFSQRQHEVASPTAKRKKVPQKFYLIVAEKDHPPLKEDFKELCQNFDNLGIQYDSLEIPKKNHRTVMFDIDTSKDATTENVIAWLNKTVASLKD